MFWSRFGRRKRLCTTLLLSLASASVMMAQSAMAGHDMSAMKEIPPPEKLPVPVHMDGIGNSRLAITATPEAQIWFTQGLNLLHDFWEYESARAFEQGIRVDPNCAMCYWGLEQALVFRLDKPTAYSRQALASAVRLKDRVTKAEQLYIEAAAAEQDAAKSEPEAESKKEVEIWRQLVKENPSDPQAKIFLSSSLRDGYDDAGEPKKGTQEAIALLEEVLKAAPDDSAANHYWIHAVEASAHPEQALRSATILASLAPASGHMVHMPGHIFYRVSDYAQAEHWFAASTAVDEKYMQTQHVDVDDDWNYVHNLMYSIANLMEEGKLEAATTLSSKLPGARGVLQTTLYLGSPRDGFARLDPRLPVALRTANWPQVLDLLKDAKPEQKFENLNFLAGALREFAEGMQALETDALTDAETSSLKLDAELWRMSQKIKDAPKKPQEDDAKKSEQAPLMLPVMPDAFPAPLVSNLSIMSLELRASILAKKKQLTEAKVLFEQAAREEKNLGYREPPAFIRPVGETAGDMLMKAADYAGAHEQYAKALIERPKSGFPLYGMARSSEAAGDSAAAQLEYKKFVDTWKNGDPASLELKHARQYLAGQKIAAVPGGSD